nr:phage portal protein [uncultured Acetatifactor sp.]
MGEEKRSAAKIDVKIVKSSGMDAPTVFYEQRVEKSDKGEQLDSSMQASASDWIPHPVDMRGLKALVDNSTILPQCIRAYKSNIAGFGISVRYAEDYDTEMTEMKAEWDALQKIIALLNMDMQTKEVFESVIRDRETYGIAYCEVIRNQMQEVAELQFIVDTPSIDMTYPLQPYVDIQYFYKGEVIPRKKKFRKFRQNVGGKTVYFKEFGDPRIMDKRDGKYMGETDEAIGIDDQANEIIEFRIGSMPYGEVRWIGQVLTVDGNRRAEVLNNSYFRHGRHTPLMILVKGGTLTDSAFTKLREYMEGIEGESGQHSFLVLETDTLETTAAFTNQEKPEVEIKDLAAILQKDELFQEYQENGRKKAQSAFLLPDLYVGYTTDFNRATAQTAMEVTEKQVFQPERASLAWMVNQKLLNGYRFRYVETQFDEPDITNPDDIQKMLNIAERAGGLTPNAAKELTYKVLGKDGCEDYEGDWGGIPLAYSKTLSQGQQADSGFGPLANMQPQRNMPTHLNSGPQEAAGGVTDGELEQLDGQIQKAASADADIVPIMLEIRKALNRYREKAGG